MYQVGAGFVRDVQEMRREIEELRSLVIRLQQEKPRQVILQQRLAKVGSTAITAASGTTPGSGTVTFHRRNADDNTMVAETDNNSDDITQTVYNFVETASGTNVYVWVGQDIRGTWWFLNEAC